MKKYLILFFSFLLVFTLIPTNATFAEKKKESDYEERLKEIGVPISLINEMDFEQKKHLALNAVGFEGAVTTTFDENGEVVSEKTIEPFAEPEFSPFATISDKDLTYTISVYPLVSSNGRKRVTVYNNFTWAGNKPSRKATDPFGISWDGDKFRAIDGTAFLSEQWKYDNGSWYTKTYKTLAYSGKHGVGWNAQLHGNTYNSTTVYNRGYGRIDLETLSTNNPSGSSQIHANYFNIKSSIGSIGIAFKQFEVTFSGTSSYDSLGTFKTFYY